MRPYAVAHFGNPSSAHRYGARPRTAVEAARQQVATLLKCQPAEVVFTSGGTESNNYAIKGAALANRHRGNHIVTTQIEHPAVLEVCKSLESLSFKVTYVPVDGEGLVDVADIERALTPRTILISVMHANNEVGTVQPIERIAHLGRARGVLVHTDAAQSVGKIPTDVRALGVDLFSVAGHKLYAPKGVGALYIREGVQLARFMDGASQEQGRRAGTENVMGMVGLGQACALAVRRLEDNARHMNAMRHRLYEGLKRRLADVHLNGHPERRLPNTLSVGFPGIEAASLLDALHDAVAASAGAACHAGETSISAVLRAMRVPVELARGTVRFSTGRMTTARQVDEAVIAVTAAVMKLRKQPMRRERSVTRWRSV